MALSYLEIYEKIRKQFPDADVKVQEVEGDDFAVIPREKIVEVCTFLKENDELQFNFCSSISGTDDTKTYWVVYHLYSIPRNQSAVLKVDAGRENPKVPSVVKVWPAADWHEREAYDMYGIQFDGHPDLRRILLPEDWVGYPLRKDYDFPDEYQGIPLK